MEQLKVAPSTYYDAQSRPPSPRELRDREIGAQLRAIFAHNYSVYGKRKMTAAAQRAKLNVGRDQVARIMKREGIRGASRAKKLHHPRRQGRRSSAGPRAAQLHRGSSQPTLGRRLYLLLHLERRCLRGVHHRCE